jgi:hypothetical protein
MKSLVNRRSLLTLGDAQWQWLCQSRSEELPAKIKDFWKSISRLSWNIAQLY